MTDTTITAPEEKAVGRPLEVLVGLINDDLDAAEKAGEKHYRAAGEKLLEAQGKLHDHPPARRNRHGAGIKMEA